MEPASLAPLAASAEHLQLAHTIKHVHRQLRERALQIGADRAWHEHLQDAQQLQRYAQAMQRLATRHWDPNSARKAGRRTRASPSTEHSRIGWSRAVLDAYFAGGLCGEQRERERRIRDEAMARDEDRGQLDGPEWSPPADGRLRLLDVGSCYNPFAQFAGFEVTAVDIAPSRPDVRRCDFLALQIVDDAPATDDASGPLRQLPAGHFDAVVFSLLLEYLPSSEQRLRCCRNAYRLLRPEGVLLLITPDSKHVGANARLMKTWRFALARLGFSRVRIEKLEHLTCMVFRRALCKAVAQRWARLHREDYMEDAIRIPQDAADDDAAIGGEVENSESSLAA